MKQCPSCSRFYEDPDAVACPACDGVTLEVVTDVAEEDLPDPMLGRVVDGRFEVRRCLGAGGMGAVYEAVQTSVERPVALKVIRGQLTAETAKRFLLEARLTSSLRNVHTVTLLDFGRDGDQLYLAMELLEGNPLDAVLDTQGALPWRTALHIVAQVARSLEEAHAKGIVHRDLKPANIFVTPMPGDPWFVKVLDFGIGKLMESGDSMTALTGTGAVIGTPAYMSPEQAQARQVDGRTDLYSLGCVLYQLLTGERPYQAESAMQVLMKHCTAPTPPLDGLAEAVPDDVHSLVHALMRKAPEDRPAGAREVAEWAEGCLAGADPASGRGEAAALDPLAHTFNGQGALAADTLAAGSVGGGLEHTALADAGVPLIAADEPRRSRWPLGLALLGVAMLAVVGWLTLGPGPGASQDGKPERGEASARVSEGAAASSTVQLSGVAPGAPAPAPSTGTADKEADAGSEAAAPDTESPAPSTAVADAGGDAASDGPEEDAAEPIAVAAPAPLEILSVPPEAWVTTPDGTRLGQTPLSVPSPSATATWTVTLKGFEPAVVTVESGQSGPVSVELAATRKKSPPKRRKAAPAKGRSLIGY